MSPIQTRFIFALCNIGLLFSCGGNATHPPADASPIQHVLVIVADDHSPAAMSAYGSSYLQTPNLDRLAQQGVMFRRAYSTSPICSASRQSLLTGKYPHATGVNQLFTPFPDEGNVTLAEHLGEHGFQSAIIGKTHFNNWLWGPLYEEGLPMHGFDLTIGGREYKKWRAANPPSPIDPDIPTRSSEQGKGVAWKKNADMLPVASRAAESEAAYFVDQALSFRQKAREQPTFTWLAFHEPHAPFAFPIEYRDLYEPDSVPLPQGSSEDDRWVPEMFRGLSETERRGIITSYYRSVHHLDVQVGRLMDSLASRGWLDNTLIVYLGDQGYLLNHHRRFEKHTFWEEAVRAPFVIHVPGLASGEIHEAPVSFLDLAPTLTDLMGIPLHPDFQGKSLRPALENPQSDTVGEYVFSEYLLDNKAMVTDGRWKYIFSSGTRDLTLSYATGKGPSGLSHRLYDLQSDPTETTNLTQQAEHGTRIEEMQQIMLGFFQRTHPEAARCPEGLTQVGKLVWYCEPRDLGGDYQERPARVFEGEE